MSKFNYNHTIRACFVGYVIQAMVNNFVPLLFVFFQGEYNISLSQIAFLVTANFAVQLTVDLLGAFIVDRIGYRISMFFAHICIALGFFCLTVLPDIFDNSYVGIIISVGLYAIGGGLLEVLVSPIVEACPTENKQSVMSLLHSFYCWGHVAVVGISTIFFAVFGITEWRWVAGLWILVSLINGFMFLFVPIYSLVDEKDEGIPLTGLLKSKMFWILMLMMFAAGASELSVSQWSSAFAEAGLRVNKSVGDLAGPMFFAVMMGISRVLYSRIADKINLEKMMIYMAGLCVISYLIISLSPVAAFSLIGCGICGFAVGIMWPGTFSIASDIMRKGGTALFALLALAGDLGCGGGPTIVGTVADITKKGIGAGILCGVIFPVIMVIGLFVLDSMKKNRENGVY